MKRLLALLLTLGVFAVTAHAHNGMQHIMGTVTSISDADITVKGADGKAQTVAVSSETRYFQAHSAVALKNIKVGDHVVIHAAKKGDHFIAAEVRVATMRMKSSAGNMNGMKMDNK